MPIPQVCVLYVTRDTRSGLEVLLGRKRTGLGVGKVVAPGGKLEAGERPEQAALRELAEEVGPDFRIADLRRVGVHEYRFPTKPAWDQDSHVFVARHLAGSPVPSSELEPSWIGIEEIPFDEMWLDARYWLPDVLRGGVCGSRYTFASDLNTVAHVGPLLDLNR